MAQARSQCDPLFNRSDAPSWFQNNLQFADWNGHDVFAAAGSTASLLDVTCTLLGASRRRARVAEYSQGGALAVAVFVRHEVAAAASVVGYLPVPQAYPNEMTMLSKNSPLLFVNTTDDELLPITLSRLSGQYIRRLGRKVKYVELSGLPHDLGRQLPANVARMFRFVHREIAKLPGAVLNKNVSVSNVDPVIWELK